MTNYLDVTVPKGWQCPICGRVYSPSYPWCNFCGNKETETTTTYTTSVEYVPPLNPRESTKTGAIK